MPGTGLLGEPAQLTQRVMQAFSIRHFTPGGAKLDVELSLVPDNLTAVQMINHILQTFSRARTQQDHYQLTARQLEELLVFLQ